MPPYDIVLILRSASKLQLKEALKRVIGQVSEHGGSVGQLEKWGEQPLPYRMRRHGERFSTGYYMFMESDLPADKCKDLLTSLTRDKGIIRPSIVRKEIENKRPCEIGFSSGNPFMSSAVLPQPSRTWALKNEPFRKKSLIEDARFDKVTNIGLHKLEVLHKEALRRSVDEEPEGPKFQWRAIIQPREGTLGLAAIMQAFEDCEAAISHIESRKTDVPNEKRSSLDVLVLFEATQHSSQCLSKSLKLKRGIGSVELTQEPDKDSTPWIPTHITDLDSCNHLVTKFEPELDQAHPGFSDAAYRQRRQHIAQIAFSYKQGDIIPKAEYTAQEVEVWSHAYRKLKSLFDTHACEAHVENFLLLEKHNVYSPKRIPQLSDVSNFLRKHSGFSLRPAAGLLSARDFLASLAFRVFQCTQYVRHFSSPNHSPEPDCIHELLGHIPMLADPDFAQFSQEIGLISLGVSDEHVEKLATLYWFTVEFGLCKEEGKVKAYGAGLLSSYGELEHALSGTPELRPFDAASAAVQPYQDEDYQPIYYVAESFEDMKEKVRLFAATISRSVELRYDPYTQSIQLLDNYKTIHESIEIVKDELSHLYTVLNKMQRPTMKSSTCVSDSCNGHSHNNTNGAAIIDDVFQN